MKCKDDPYGYPPRVTQQIQFQKFTVFIVLLMKEVYKAGIIKENSRSINPLSDNPTTWSYQITWKFMTNCVSVFDHFVGLGLKRLK